MGNGHAIFTAVSEGDLTRLEELMKAESSSLGRFVAQDGSSLLHLSVSHGPTCLTRALLEIGMDVNLQRDIDGATPLHLAAIGGRLSVAEMLLSHPNIDDTLRDASGRSAYDFAKRNKSIATAFEYARNKFISKAMISLQQAVQRGDLQNLMALMQTNRIRYLVDLNVLDAAGETLLHRAVKGGRTDMVSTCLQLGCDPFLKNRKGKLPIEVTHSNDIRELLRQAPMIGSRDSKDHSIESKVSGYLLKYVNFASGYKRRYVVLEDGILSYYKAKEDCPIRCKGTLNVQFSKLVVPPGDRLSFELRTSKYSMYLKAESDKEAAKWVMALGRWQRASREAEAPLGSHNGSANRAAETLHQRSQTSMAGMNEYRETLQAAQDCIHQLEAIVRGSHLTNQGVAGNKHQSMPVTDSVCQHLIQSLVEFFRLCDERELYWQGRLDTEIRQRAMVEEALRKSKKAIDKYSIESEMYNGSSGSILRTRSSSIITGSNETSTRTDEEFYDAVDEMALKTAMISLSDKDVENDTNGLLLEPNQTVRWVQPDTLEELRIPERAVPAIDLSFIASSLEGYPEVRRNRLPVDATSIPPISIWNIVKNAIGKDLTRIPVPVNFSEPISMLQRLAEDLEYADLLYMASTAADPLMRLQYVAAFAVSPYSSTDGRVSKPFNPLLGETFEYASHEHGFRYVSEQVSHHPPISACYCESSRYVYFAEVVVRTKFLKSLELVPDGLNHVILKETGEHFSWRKVTTAVYNIIMGKMWLDHYGTLRVTNHKTGDYVDVEFKATGWRTSDPRRLEGTAFDSDGNAKYKLDGYWHRYLRTTDLRTDDMIELWRRRPLPPWSSETYNFTYFTMTLNELTPSLASRLALTDSRLRPDQRAMEVGYFDAANDLKVQLEEKQRAKRHEWESSGFQWEPSWFRQEVEPDTGEPYWRYVGGYWETREKADWTCCPDIYLSDSSQDGQTSSTLDESGKTTGDSLTSD